ncbi:MAG: hypothetical protein OXU61_02700, partial [Gammaproteobacteria bacterium]|nr:hypothetical protein [Gammaproteobacteria bacterium]
SSCRLPLKGGVMRKNRFSSLRLRNGLRARRRGYQVSPDTLECLPFRAAGVVRGRLGEAASGGPGVWTIWTVWASPGGGGSHGMA